MKTLYYCTTFAIYMVILVVLLYLDTDAFSFGRAMMQDIMQALPGIDEAMSYSEVMKFVCIFFFCCRNSVGNCQSI